MEMKFQVRYSEEDQNSAARYIRGPDAFRVLYKMMTYMDNQAELKNKCSWEIVRKAFSDICDDCGVDPYMD